MTDRAEAVLAVLQSAPAPLTSKQVSRRTSIPWRQVIDAVSELRREGHCVATTNAGYKLTTDPREIKATRDRLIGKLRGLREVIDALDAMHPEAAQGTLFEEVA